MGTNTAEQNIARLEEWFFPYRGDRPYVYLSYTKNDAQRVNAFVTRLYADGLRIWYSSAEKDEDAALQAESEQRAALAGSTLMLLFVTQEMAEDNSISNEIMYALSHRLQILAVYLESVELPYALQLQLSRCEEIVAPDYVSVTAFYQALLRKLPRAVRSVPSKRKKQHTKKISLQISKPKLHVNGKRLRIAAICAGGGLALILCAGALLLWGANTRWASKVAGWYAEGTFVSQNDAKAAAFYEKAALRGEAAAQAAYAKCLESGTGIERDELLALEWYQKAAAQGNADAWYHCGVMLMRSENKGRQQEAYKLLQAAAEKKQPDALYEIGFLLYNGSENLGIEKDAERALAYYKQAAQLGQVDAALQYGSIYNYNRLGIEQDYTEAFWAYRIAAQAGDFNGMLRYGEYYQQGRCVEKNPEEAIRWYTKALDSEEDAVYGEACVLLGRIYLELGKDGTGDEEALKQARSWFQKGADVYNSTCMHELGDMYWDGIGGDKDVDKAAEWAIKSRNVYQIFPYGEKFENGTDVEKDMVRAKQLYTAAAVNGSDDAIAALKRINGEAN